MLITRDSASVSTVPSTVSRTPEGSSMPICPAVGASAGTSTGGADSMYSLIAPQGLTASILARGLPTYLSASLICRSPGFTSCCAGNGSAFVRRRSCKRLLND